MKILLVILVLLTFAQSTYISTEYEQFKGKSIEQLQKYLGLQQNSLDNIPERSYKNLLNLIELPTSFDSRQQWPNCIHPIRDQGQCGSCWAFAGSEVLTDRFCINSQGKVDLILSPQFMVSCDTGNYGCDGGFLDMEWFFLQSSGTVSEACWPYESQKGNPPPCRSTCLDGSDMKFYKSKFGTFFKLADVLSIKMDIMVNGPVEAAFTVYQDFMNYKSGIYTRQSDVMLGGHAIKIVGWGQENGIDFWICANSWTSSWGENGYFRIAFGQCKIDKQVVVAEPLL